MKLAHKIAQGVQIGLRCLAFAAPLGHDEPTRPVVSELSEVGVTPVSAATPPVEVFYRPRDVDPFGSLPD